MKTRSSSEHQPPPIQIQLDEDDVRASKRLIKDDINQLIPQSTLDVVSNNDLLIEILLRLPFLSLCLLKFVSKRWLSLIRQLNFTRPSGVFIQGSRTVLWPRLIPRCGHDFVPFDVSISKNITTFPFHFPNKILITQSCNGLLLCQWIQSQTYYVYNPTIKQFKKLPRCCFSKLVKADGCVTMRMAFDPATSPHYTVFSIRDILGNSIQVQTYNSETRKWRVCDDQFSYEDFRYFNSGIYRKGAFHWIASGHYYKLDVQHDPLLTILPIPFGPIHKFCISHGSFLFISLGYHELGVYEMKNGYSNKWSKMYNINLENVMCNERPERTTPPCLSSSFLGIVEGEREEDLLVVLNLHGNVVQYNIMLKTVHKLGRDASYQDMFPFIVSFARV